MTKENGKPQIRFAKFKDTWEQRKLSAIADKVTEKNVGLQYIETFTNSAEFGIISQRDFFDHDIAKMSSLGGYYIVRSEDFVYNPRISTSAPVGPINRNKLGRIGVMSPLYTVFRPHDIDTTYLEYFFKSKYWHSFMNFNGDSGARSDRFSIKDSVFFEMPIPIPHIDEQKKIGEYLTYLDHLITLHQRKYDKLTKAKKSMLEKMFPKNGTNVPEIRFKGFTDAWEQRKLGDFGKTTGGTSIESEFSEEGQYKVISIGSYSENSVYNDQGLRAIKSDKTNNRVLNRNDLTMILNDKTTSGNIIGRVLLIEESGIYVYNQRTERIEINVNEYDPVFLYEMLNAPNIREKIIKQAQGNTQIYVNWPTISLLDYMIPLKEEQVKIGECLHNLSNLITLHQRKLEKLKILKKACLEKMFV